VLANLAAMTAEDPEAPKIMSGTGSDRRHLLVVCTADRGLAGAFNSSIARLAAQDARRLMQQGKDVRFLCVGRKGYDILRRTFREQMAGLIDFRSVRKMSFGEATQVGDRVLGMFAAGEFDVATLYFSEFKSVISQKPTALQIIPAAVPAAAAGEAEQKAAGGAVYEYEPDATEILDALAPRNLKIQILRALLENAASEQGARMTAMDNATRNAGDMINRLTLDFNRTRQAQITKELIEIISGAEAL
jgi:F-type H+-transporting ATPase subunit gamma